MKLRTFKKLIIDLPELNFMLPDGSYVPPHFHVTEVGSSEYRFVDCGGTLRKESKINFQLWSASDKDHRLSGSKLANIIEIAEEQLQLENTDIEIEYQGKTIEKYALDFQENEQGELTFLLQPTVTDCLAKEACGIPTTKPQLKLSELQTGNSCAPGSGCC